MPEVHPDDPYLPIAAARAEPGNLTHLPLGFGGSWYVPYSSPGDEDGRLRDALEAAFEGGVRHFDTASGYGDGHSEEIYGDFIKGRRSAVFLASKAGPLETSAAVMTAEIEGSLRRLNTDYVDLYYIHWPRTGSDMRPQMEALEKARAAGKVLGVGVSNFSVDQMQEVQQVGRIDAHQLCYNLLWRYPEDELIPFCVENGISVVTYSSLAHGILTGKFGRTPDLAPGDQRNDILPFREDVWPHVFEAVEELRAIARDLDRPLMHLAIRWNLSRPGVSTVVIGARNRAQAEANVAALVGEIPAEVFERMTAISDAVRRHMPHEGNVFNYYP